jgi:hypothetical protein
MELKNGQQTLHYFGISGISMGQVATLVLNGAVDGRSIQDRAGLTGKYDITERQREGIAVAKGKGSTGDQRALTTDQAAPIRHRAAAGEHKAALARELNVSTRLCINL